MKGINRAVFVLALAAVFATAAGAAKWTLMIYQDAENNGLHSAALDDINEMEWCSDNVQVNIIVLFDGDGSSDQTIYKIWGDDGVYNSNIVSSEVDDGGAVIPPGGEATMSDWETFDDFVDWTIDTFPADNYLVCLWNHGDGIFREGEKPVYNVGLFKGFCGGMKLWEIDNVLEDAAAEIGHDIGIVGFDVCLLGQVETGHQLKDSTSYVISSEDTEPLDGWDYFAFDVACDNPNTTPRNLAIAIVDDYLDSDGGNPSPGPTQSAQDMTYFDTGLAVYLDDFCDELLMACYAYESDIAAARSGAWSPGGTPKDLYEFAENIAEDTDLPSSLRNAADDFCTSWETYIVAGGVDSPNDAHGGATVYFPTNASGDGDWNTYIDNITFIETEWDEFLVMFADPYPMLPNYFTFVSYDIDDGAGDGDGVAEPGEQVNVAVTVQNDGYEDATGVTGAITTTGDVTIDDGTADFGTIPADGGTGEGTFTVTIGASCPEPSFISFDLAMHSSAGRYDQDLAFTITVGWGFEDDVEGDTEAIWTHGGAGDTWHVETQRSHSPTHSWKCGGNGAGNYGNNMNAYLMSPGINVPTEDPGLSFWTCYWIEDDGQAFDKGYVEISTNGTNWTQLGNYFTGNQTTWIEKTYDLTSYAGELVFVRFRLVTDSSVTYEGWYVDDISLSGVVTDADGLVVYDFAAAPKDDGLLLSWRADGEESLLGYDIYRRAAPESTRVDEPNVRAYGTPFNNRGDDGYLRVNDGLITGTGKYRFFDGNLEAGETYEYLLKAVYELADLAVGNATGEVGLPTAFALSQNRPNPFATTSVVSFAVPKPANVEIVLYDLAGRKVGEVVNRDYEPGTYEVTISADGLGSGIYLLRMSAGGEFTALKKLVVTR